MDKNLAEFVQELIDKSIWSTPSVSAQPQIVLIRWSIMETQHGTHHFVGYNYQDREGRVSTAIQTFDPATAQGVTRSGRTYLLSGPPGFDADGAWVWHHWAQAHRLEGKDVTSEYWQLISEGKKNESP